MIGSERCYERAHDKGMYEQKCFIPKDFFNWGNYSIDFLAFQRDRRIENIGFESDILSFTVANKQIAVGGYMGREPGDITPQFVFEEQKIS